MVLFIGPETLLRKASGIGAETRLDEYFDADGGDVVQAHEWRCVRTINGELHSATFPSAKPVHLEHIFCTYITILKLKTSPTSCLSYSRR